MAGLSASIPHPPQTMLKKLTLFAAFFGIMALALALWMMNQGGDLAKEAYKLLLQFLLITGVGAILVAAMGSLRDRDTAADQRRKDEDARRSAMVVALQNLDRDLGSTYRALKAVKRQLRTHLIEAQRDDNGRPGPPYSFPEDAFRKSMTDLLVAQIRAEDIRHQIEVRSDLFDEAVIRQIIARLSYAARFFHDVHEDFERGKVRIEDSLCLVDARCSNIDSLINGRSLPEDLPTDVSTALGKYRNSIANSQMDISQQHSEIDEIEKLRKTDPKERRFRMIADDCFALASAEIRRAIAKKSGSPVQTGRNVSNRSY